MIRVKNRSYYEKIILFSSIGRALDKLEVVGSSLTTGLSSLSFAHYTQKGEEEK